MEYQSISADCHIRINLCWLPPALIVDEATPDMKSRMPYVTSGPSGDHWCTPNGANLGVRDMELDGVRAEVLYGIIAEQFAHLPVADVDWFTCANAAEFYRRVVGRILGAKWPEMAH